MATNRLAAVSELGQSIWYDNIRRGLITSGDLQHLIEDDAVVGITSNPTIFEKAIDGSTDYDEAIRELVRQGVTDAQQVFEALAIEDIQMAADILRPIYDRTHGLDGYISLEVSPTAANDTQRTIEEARHLFQRADRPNVFIKIPATEQGLPAIEQMIYEGVNINVTLIFSLERYRAVAEAYIRGLEHRRREGQPVTGIASVASFFVSRVDTLVDKLLDQQIAATEDEARQAELRALQGRAAIANARLAYQIYLEVFHGERFQALRAEGAAPQRCLWASTSTKNPAYRDVMYVEGLIGPETVNTLPPQTIVAFQEHGEVNETLTDDIEGMRTLLDQLAAHDIDMAAVTHQLEIEGVKAFADSYNELLERTAAKIEKLRLEMVAAPVEQPGTAPNLISRQQAELGALQGAVDETLARADREHFAQRVWEKDPSLWKPNPEDQNEITDRLGWLTVAETMSDALPRLNELRDDVRAAGFTHAVLLGMGGSSLAPEVLSRTFGAAAGQPELLVLDSTDPATILDVERRIDLERTLFIVASKSGETIETLSHFAYFYDKVHARLGDGAGSRFIAITDPGTKLERLAQDHRFRATFRNPADIGGRYSALSYFGLVPAAILGLDLATLLARATTMQHACHGSGPAAENPGLWLGAVMGTCAIHGRDKVTLVVSPPVMTFGYWIEQLIAESTGKEGKGILPVEGEPVGKPSDYGNDRLFVYLRTEQGFDSVQDERVAALRAAGQPVVTLALGDPYDLGGEFFRWEFATAIAGALLGINAFDQPNVQEAKDRTSAILGAYDRTQQLPVPPAVLRTENVTIYAEPEDAQRLHDAVSLQAALEAFFGQARPGDYIALLAYIQRTPATEAALEQIRVRLRMLCRLATTVGFGPRFQHSTGQLHKGGANTGLFLQLTAHDHEDVAIPGEPYSFGILKQAQALGDLRALQAHERRVIRIDLGADAGAGLSELRQALDVARLG
jgi:transaldolase/glucose-6-phosphate isomerase